MNKGDVARDWVQVNAPPQQKQLGTLRKHSSYGLRSKLLGRHQSPAMEFKPTSCPSEESFTTYTSIPASPPPWSPSTRSTHSSPVEYVCHAITTPGASAYGEKSAGIARVSKDALDVVNPSPSSPVKERSCTPDAPIPEVRETQATPEQSELRAARRRTKRISVRLRPISQFSDFNADFIVPGSPRLSRRYSAQAQKYQPEIEGDFVLEESWEEDIDYSYDHAAESHCDFEWEKSSTYAVSTYGGDNDELDSQQSPQSSFLTVPEKGECTERRITGQFEAHLLLPGSAGSDTASTTKRSSIRNHVCENATGIIFRAARSSLSHRSIDSAAWSSTRSSASISKMLSRNYRDELARVAEHLEDHIAFLNAEISVNSTRDSLKPPPISTVSNRKSLTRSRTDSDATCVTLCSDAETITPTDSSELVTPPNSNHNSFTLHKQYDEERMAKGLSFPASTIPGVIEFSPEIHDLSVPGDEVIPFI